MADGTRKPGDRGGQAPDEAALSARLKSLGDRLDRQTKSQPTESAPAPPPDRSGLAKGLRLSTELVAGVIVGAGIGWLLDRWLGISPFGFIVFLLLGFAAGLLNLMRAAGATGKPG